MTPIIFTFFLLVFYFFVILPHQKQPNYVIIKI